MKKDVSLQLLRIFSMLMIVLCHLCIQTKIDFFVNISQFFNVGVFVFLFLSGYLYGKKEIIDIKKFFTNRIKKLMIPFYIFLIYIAILNFIKQEFKLSLFFSNLFNLQYFFGSLKGMEHLWFMTELMLCYSITPFLYIKGKSSANKKRNIILIAALLSFAFTLINEKIVNVILYFLVYVYGFYYKDFKGNHLITSILLFIVAIGIRLVFKIYFDGTILYNSYVVFLTHTMIAISLFNIFKLMLKNIKANRIIDWFDEISFYVYISHYQFIYGPLGVINCKNMYSLTITSLFSITLSIVSAIILQQLSKFLTNKISK